MMVWPFKRKERYPEIKDDIDRKLKQSELERLILDRRLNYIRQEIAVMRRGR